MDARQGNAGATDVSVEVGQRLLAPPLGFAIEDTQRLLGTGAYKLGQIACETLGLVSSVSGSGDTLATGFSR